MNLRKSLYVFLVILISAIMWSCGKESQEIDEEIQGVEIEQTAILNIFSNKIDLDNLQNYSNQEVPNYIAEDNTAGNNISNEGATLGRILFYDKNLSVDNSTSCASCHQQANAFGDDAIASLGANGTTGRHSMRLVNARFSEEERFFWDERAATLEEQTTMPIQDHAEMGFSGENGDPDFNDLIAKLEVLDYYQELFTFVYGDVTITEARMQQALAQFIRSIQSFDSKYDIGRAQVNNDGTNFPNYTNQENEGKQLFLGAPQFNNIGLRIGGGIGCGGCHRAPEFGIDDNSDNNGMISTISGIDVDLEVTRSPTLRDIIKSDGSANGPFMHNGFSEDFMDVLDHYNLIDGTGNNNLDRRLRPNGNTQNLQMTNTEKEAVIAFVKTLSGTEVYTSEKWSDPFN